MILYGLILILRRKRNSKRRPGLVVSRYEFNRKTMFSVICPITSTIKNLPTRYSLPEELDIKGQVIITQLKSLDFKERKLKNRKLTIARHG